MTTTAQPIEDLAGNPFAVPSRLPYGLPDFAAVRDEHYLPAFRAGMAGQLAEIEAIVTDPAPPDEDNTLLALERSGRLLHRVALAFFNVVSADRTPRLAEIEVEIAPLLAAHRDAVYLDHRLFDRVEALAARVADGAVTLPDDAAWLLHTLRKDFGRAGVSASPEVQAEVREANTRISALETTFGQRLVADANASAVLLPDAADLEGLPQDAIGSARSAAERRGMDGFLLELRAPSQQPALASLRRREVRRRVHEAAVARGGRGGEHDTREVLLELVRLRARRAELLGYVHHAAYVAEDGTARTTAAVDEVLARLAPAATANARREAVDLERALRSEVPGARLEAWDWGHYAERVRQERYALDDAALRPYLELGRVLRDGVFHAATELYGLTFRRRTDLTGYHPDVEVYEVRDADGTGLGLFLADWYTRDAKEGGAWMNNLVDQSRLLAELPVVVNNHNITPPSPGDPTLLTWDEVTTLFHEFGHALHGLLSDVRLPSQSGTEVPRDFVEYPSQVNEIWAWEPEVLARYAVHHVTGEPLPEAWIRTLLDARQFNEGFGTTEYLAAALLDQAWHQLTPDSVPDDVAQVAVFEQAALEAAGVAFEPVPPRYRTTYFNHVFGGGYAAAYYSYIWSEVLDADTVEWFKESGGLRRAAGERFRRVLLSRGGSLDVMDAFRELRGREPRIEPLLVRRGLV
jgi:peptidyl-dipeptidase Dcp